MATIYATNDGDINKNIAANFGGSWDACRDATSGVVASGGASTTYGFTRVVVFTYSGHLRWIIHRVFMEFDTSGISTAPSEATLKIYGTSNSSSDIIVVKGTQSDTLTGTDYDNLDFSTAYSAELATWSTSGYNDITLNATARQAMVDNDNFKIAIINYDYDYLDVDPGSSISLNHGGYYSEADLEYRPYIDYTPGFVAEVSHSRVISNGGDINLTGGSLQIGEGL